MTLMISRYWQKCLSCWRNEGQCANGKICKCTKKENMQTGKCAAIKMKEFSEIIVTKNKQVNTVVKFAHLQICTSAN